MAGSSLFPAALEEELGYGKYTSWVLQGAFPADCMLGLLAMVAEFDAHAQPILRQLQEDSGEWRGAERSVLALAGLRSFVQGERFDRYEWSRRMQRMQILGDGRLAPEPEGNAPHIDPGPLTGLPAELPMGEARARWAGKPACTLEHLQCLLWLVGEFSARAHVVLPVLEKRRARLAGAERALVALQAIHSVVWMKERIDLAEFDERAARGRGTLEFADLPDAVRTALSNAVSDAKWGAVRKVTWATLLIDRADGAGRNIEAEVRPPASIALKRYLQWEAVPEAVAKALVESAPDFRNGWGYGRIAADGSISTYEFEYHPKRGKIRLPRRILVSPDGRFVRDGEF